MLKINRKRLINLWQLLIVVSCLATMVMLFVYSTQINKLNHKLLYDQTESLSRVLLRQAGSVAFTTIQTGNSEKLQELVNNLDNEELILDASVYDLEGKELASSKDAMPLDQLTGLHTPLSVASIGRQQLVQPVTDGKKILGFIRITLEHGKVIKNSANRLEQNINLFRSMLLVALLTGALFTFTVANRIEVWLSSLPHNHSH